MKEAEGRKMDFEANRDAAPQGDHTDFAARQGSAIDRAGATPAGKAAAVPAGAVRLPVGPDGVVVLPEGATLDDITVRGRDLVVTLENGQVYVITDGAVFVPQIAVDGVVVPPLNLAALLVGAEPQPAAGTVSSSGGNFADPVGDIQAAYDLGDLLPYTELAFPQPEQRELLPELVDRQPTIQIQGTGPATTDAAESVNEAGLPAQRPGGGIESPGSAAGNGSQITTGIIIFDSPDGVASIKINDVTVTGAAGQQIAGAYGTLVLGAPNNGQIAYTYTLNDNTAGDSTSELFTVVIVDNDGDSATARLTVSIIDDVPTANPDVDSVTEDGPTVANGNVLTGVGGADANTTDGVADVQGADGATVTAVSFAPVSGPVVSGTVGEPLAGAYGTLQLASGGGYTYTLNNSLAAVQGLDGNDTLTETFNYTITDGDGDPRSTTLTITINGSNDPIEINYLDGQGAEETVDEANLADGSDPLPGALTQTGTFDVTGTDGIATIVVGGKTVFTAADGFVSNQTVSTPYGTLTITGVTTVKDAAGDAVSATVSYSYVLQDNTLLHTGANNSSLTEQILVSVTDTDASSDTALVDIKVVDDSPLAADDADSIAAGTYGPAVGNVITDAENDGGRDTRGADGAVVVSVASINVPANTDTTTDGSGNFEVAGEYGTLTLNADGTYSYTRNAGTPGGVTDTFNYTIRDGDGEPADANLVITIGDSDTTLDLPVTGTPGVTQVLEAGLPAGSASVGNGEFASGTFSYTAPDGPVTITINSIVLTGVAGQQIPGAHGTLTITGIANGVVSYSYELTTNTSGDATADSFAVVVADSDNESSSGDLVISIIDDEPAANPDVDSVTEDGPTVANGNVLTGVGGADANTTDGVADVQGADGATVTAVSFAPVSGPVVSGTVGEPLAGAYGTLQLASGGGYTYTLNNSLAAVQGLDGNDTLTETFNYTITDGDGDPRSTTLTITINGSNDPIEINYLDGQGAEETVDEANLADGSDPLPGALTQTGTFDVTGTDGIATIVVGGKTVFTAADGFVSNQTVSTPYGTLTITGVTTVKDAAGDAVSATVSYSYVLLDNTLLHTAGNDDSLIESITVSVTDSDNSPDTASLDIRVLDDTPSAVDDGPYMVAEQTALTIDALANDTFGADGVNIATSVAITTDPTKGVVSYNPATGQFTYTPNAGAEGPDSFTYTITDGDNDPSTATVTLILADDSVPIIQSTNLTVDEDGLDGANADATPALQLSPTEVTGTGLATASGTATVNFGADKPDSLAGAITLVDTAALDNQLYTVDNNPVTFELVNGVLVGSSGDNEVIRIAITNAVDGDNAGEAVYTYSVTLLQPVRHATPGTEDTAVLSGIQFEVTDSDDTSSTGSFNVTILDDVPSVDVIKGGDGSVLLTTRDAYTDSPDDQDSASSTAKFADVFSVSATPGADGQASQTVVYTLNVVTAASGLQSHDQDINLFKLADGTVVGATSATAPANATAPSVVFSITVTNQGVVTVTQYQQVDHELAQTSGYDTDLAVLANGLVTLTATATLTDRDLDVATDSETVDLGGNIRFADDGPTLTNVSLGTGVQIDETNAMPGGYGVNGITAVSASAVITATAAFGADGPANAASLTYSLELASTATPLATAVGDYPITLALVGTDTVEGRYNDGISTKVAFRLVIGTDGKLTLTEFVPLEHNQDGLAPLHNDSLNLTDALGASLVTARITAKDFDGDTATATVAIGGAVTFLDDGPDAVNDTDSIAAGSNGPALGNVITGVGTTNNGVDYSGADGASVTSVTGTGGAVSVPGTGTITVQGAYGVLTISASGEYSYARTPGLGGGQSDVFTYRLTDNDGDYDTATLTISIGDLTPVATTASATVDDDGLAFGIAGGTGDINANGVGDTNPNEAIFTGTLGSSALGDGTNTFLFQASLAGTTQVIGQETVTYSVSADGSLLTAKITTSADATRLNTDLFTVQITNQQTGAYTVTLKDNVLHAAGGNEQNIDITVPYQLRDADGDLSVSPGTLGLRFNDDTPEAVDDGTYTVAEQTSVTINALANDTFGADGVNIATSVAIGTLPTKGVVSYNSVTGQFTYTPNAGAEGADSFTYTITDGDGDPSTATVTLNLAADSVPSIQSTNLTVDEDGLGGANADATPVLQPSPTEVTGTGLATASGTATVNFGADKPANLAGSITLLDTAALDNQLYTVDNNPVTFALVGGVLVGSSNGNEVIRIEITGAVNGAGAGEVVYSYSVTLLQPVRHATPGLEDTAVLSGVQFRVTDSDSTSSTGSFNVTILDDVPSVDVIKGNDSTVLLTTRDAYTDGTPTQQDSASSTAKFADVFSVSATPGADGQASQTVVYALNVLTAASGLQSHDQDINLFKLADGTVVGSTSATAPASATAASVVFSITVTNQGVVTVTQYQQVDHDLAQTGGYDTDLAVLANGLVTLTATATLTDRDLDVATDSETVDLGGNIRFADDGPALTNVSLGTGVQIDETSAMPGGYGVNGITAVSASPVITATAAFGADGPANVASLAYSLELVSTATQLATAVGDYPITLALVGTDTVEGRYNGGVSTKVAFRLVIGTDGKLMLTEFVPLEHTQDGNTPLLYNDALTLTDALGASLVTARITAKDFDGDTATATVAIGGAVTFLDDGPDAVNDTDSIAAGSNGPALGNLITGVGTTNNGVDYSGADGAAVTSVTGTGSPVAVPGTGSTIVQGAYGVLTISANGEYSYARTPGLGGGSQEVFTYTLTDNDGDYDTATLTISIGDLMPVATSASATVDDEGLAFGIAGGTGDINANLGGDTNPNEAIFTGTLGQSALGDGTNTFLFQASLAGITQVIGQETVTYSVSPDGSLLTAKITTTADATRLNTDLFTVQITNQQTGAYTLTLKDNVLHTAGGDEQNIDITVPYQLRDQDGDLSLSAGTLNLRFNDDTPIAIQPSAIAVSNQAGAPTSAALDDAALINSYGADGGTVRFSPTLNGTNSGLTSSFVAITYTLVNPQTLEGWAGANKVFTITLDPANATWSIDMDGKVDATSTINYATGGYDFRGGNNSWGGFVRDAANDSQDLLLTPEVGGVDNGTMNFTANVGGVGGAPGAGSAVGPTETFRVDFVTDLTGDPADGSGDYDTLGNRDHAFEGHYTVNGASALFKSTGGSTVRITAFDDQDGNNIVGDGDLDTITGVTIVWRGFPSGLIVPTSGGTTVTLNDRDFTVTLNGDGSVSVSGVEGAGGSSMVGTVISVFTANGYNSVEYSLDTGGAFQIGDFGATTLTNDPVNFTVPVEVVDGDGDVSASSNLAVTLNPVPPVVIDLDGDGAEFLALSAGVTYDYFGQSVATAWAGPDDGILAIDLNGDGKVSSSAEFVFGGNGLTDLEGIAAQYDSNHDGVLDAQDNAFASFGVWQDADSDGVADDGEFSTLADLGIASIKLTSDGVSYTAAEGDVTVAGTTTVTYADGSTTTAADASFAIARLSQQMENAVTTAAASGLVAASLAAVIVSTDSEAQVAPATSDTDEAPLASIVSEPAPATSTDDSALLAEAPASEQPALPESHAQDIDSESRLVAFDDGGAAPAGDSAADGAGDDAGLHLAAAIVFDAPASVQAMDALLVAAAAPDSTPAPQADPAAVIDQALAEGHAAGFVDSLLDNVVGADGGDAGGGHSADLSALLAAHVDAGSMAGIAPAAFDFDQAGMEMLAAAQA